VVEGGGKWLAAAELLLTIPSRWVKKVLLGAVTLLAFLGGTMKG